MLKVKISLPNEEGQQIEKNFEVDLKTGATALQVLETIFKNEDPTLVFRYSCRIGLCGTCSVKVNGKAGLSCMQQAVPAEDGIMKIEPMSRGKTVIGLVKEI
ncbi:2Fe-2S iron-sulfur cluster-binding protein [Bacillus sp. Marseille-P3661]|uniref:2Fe-2S iron-sulfur cluster-binding protein n=1 Tax=Bacillus sp. Marseille-P3661 TaxID=1936234 RepID=UPI0015E16D1B|nr:2Fe-2S iron-sulfur cluster-binding protein [Bacillus sp. Marseille-P3661]